MLFALWLAVPLFGPCLRYREIGNASFESPYRRSGARPFQQKSICLSQLTLGKNVVQIWSRYPRTSEATTPSNRVALPWSLLNPDSPEL
jgi:hypothetical protein